MISKINKSEFKSRLAKLTTSGNPKLKGSPLTVFTLGSKRNKFYGWFDDNKFAITKQSVFLPVPYILRGSIKANRDATTEVEYVIQPIWFGYLVPRLIPIAVFSIMGIAFLKNPDSNFPFSIFAIVVCIGTLISLLIEKTRLRVLESDFKKTFEIQ